MLKGFLRTRGVGRECPGPGSQTDGPALHTVPLSQFFLPATSVVALFVSKDSVYKSLGLDCYDVDRDARTYFGNLPVVAHPPCQLWGKLAKVNYARWGGDHNKPGNDGGCFRFALDSVNRCGGVLEHPAGTYAWKEFGLVRPSGSEWVKSGDGWVCEVWQSAYGHRAQKRTWLYCSGTDRPINPKWDKVKGTHQIGFYDQRGKSRNKPTLSKREANATPLDFAEYLIYLAWSCSAGKAIIPLSQ